MVSFPPLTHHRHTHTQKKIPSLQTPNPHETDSSLMFETVVSWWNAAQTSPSPSQTNFLLFTSVWTSALAVPYLALSPRFLPTAAHKFGILAAEAVTMIFWLAAFLATAVFLSSLAFCRGIVCGAARGAVVFGAFEWYEPALPFFFRRVGGGKECPSSRIRQRLTGVDKCHTGSSSPRRLSWR